MAGPLSGLRIIEMAGIGPGPFAGMMLADNGAEVIRIERPGTRRRNADILTRSRRSIIVDMKFPEGVNVIRDLVRNADGLIEGMRPGVMERCGLGPEVLLGDNPGLVYGRVTGWGQTGPLAKTAGHDINYISITGTLHACGREAEQPTPPLSLIGDFGGGGMLLAFGMVSALLHAKNTGQGQVIDCAMVDGAATLMAMFYGYIARGEWRDERGVNLLDTGAHFYDTYLCKDGRYLSLGSLEPQFYAKVCDLLGLKDDPLFQKQMDRATWPLAKEKLRSLFLTRDCEEWCELLNGSDTCVSPVLSLREATLHPHNKERGMFIEVDSILQPAPAPRFLGTPAAPPKMARECGAETDEILTRLGYSREKIAELRHSAVVN